MKRILSKIFCLAFLALSMVSLPIEVKGLGNAEDKVKLFNAKQAYLSGDYSTALKLYQEVYKDKPNDGSLPFFIGDCYLAMGKYDEAQEYLEKSKSLSYAGNTELYLDLGKAYHMNGLVDRALEAFNTFRSSAGSLEKVSESKVDYYIAQCNTAKELMAKPTDVTITNAGESINSSYADKTPLLFPDGKTLVFTTRRPAGKLSIVDKEADSKYFDDVYSSAWDELNNKWSDAEPIAGNVNYSESHDACTGISPDGKQLFLYKNEDFLTQSGDIFVSRVSPTGKWQTSKPLTGLNSPYYEDGACLSPDGNTLYFISERKLGYGRGDIYMAQRISNDDWEKPVNLGSVVNTSEDEVGLFMASDSKTLFFCSKGHNSMGSYDIFKTVFENGQWSKPVNLGYPINSTRRDGPIVFTSDAKTAYFSSDRKGGSGETDIYKADLSKNILFTKIEKKEKKDWTGLSIIKGMLMDLEAGQAVETEIVIYDEFGQRITAITSNNDGEYSVTLPGDKKYEMRIEPKQYKPIREKIYLSIVPEGVHTQVKDIVLSRK